MTEGPDCTP